ncbi:uncharacterized protein LOC103138730 isoform X2 [Poecilia formosa]|uniref:uncharacterized protein LOC103138730 isoform X2 n=1 Tax=Poecilia formosa TaxID=48698 RepID=UPI0007B91198|nr:PREDICTED: uncharacterized protein LOC103138730 isoform X2 [Poecilia formosa]
MLEVQWSEALGANKIRAIIHWLKKLHIKGDACLEEHLQTFGSWLQRTSEFTKKELLTLCFSRCQGLWMFLDRSSFVEVHILLQRLQNLLILVQWLRKQQGFKAPCMICRDTQHSSNGRNACWNQELWTLKRHIWLGRLVQWWGIMGLLPRFPAQELRRISQMWKEMELSHQEMCLKTAGWNKKEMERCGFLIKGMVMQLSKRHGCIWTSEDCTDQCYPPPSLHALLKLVLVPCTDNMLVQGILLYFILDVVNFLQCKDNLLQSFCHAFTIPHRFSHQIKAFWMFDHGRTKASMELLLSPKAAVPQFSWQHRCIIISLLKSKQHHMALKYLQWTKPPIETTEDAKLYAEVFLLSSCLTDAWALLKRSHTENEDMVMYLLQACKGVNLHAEAVKYICHGCNGEEDCHRAEVCILQQKNKDCFGEMVPYPLSATLYQNQAKRTMSSEELVKLVKKAVTEVRKPNPRISEVVWPNKPKRKSSSREIFLSVQALRRLTPSPFPMEAVEETEQTADAEDDQGEHHFETQDILTSENQRSLSALSFSSASSAPLSKYPHFFDSTITLQRISAFLTDQEIQSKGDDEDDEDNFTSVADSLPQCWEPKLSPDGATEQLSLYDLGKSLKSQDKVIFYALQGGEDDRKYTPGEQVANDSPKMVASGSHKSGDQSDGFLVISADQKGDEHHQQKEALGCGIQDFSSTPSTTLQDPVTDMNQSLVSEDNTGQPTIDNTMSSCLLGPSSTNSLANFTDFSAKQTDDKQAEGKELAGWRGKAPQQRVMSGRTESRKGKRVKRI